MSGVLIIFDWDGTLSDSTGRIVEAMQAAAAEIGLAEPSADAVRNIIGLGLPEAVVVLYPEQEATQHEQLREAYSEHYRYLDRTPCDLFPGALEVMAEMRERDWQLAVATGKSRRGLDRVLDGLGLVDHFDATRCADETASKPDPLMLQQILAQLDKGQDAAVVVGDSEYDMAMANNAGLAAVGVSFGVHSPQRLGLHKPLAVVDSLTELLSLDFQRVDPPVTQ